VKTAVSIPDPLFEAADRLARHRKMSRSALYAEALEQLLAAHTDDVTARLDEVYSQRSSTLNDAVAAAQADALREEW
jgi:metal-responsive CopG/Arc/MetJ family transcriptional regulator